MLAGKRERALTQGPTVSNYEGAALDQTAPDILLLRVHFEVLLLFSSSRRHPSEGKVEAFRE